MGLAESFPGLCRRWRTTRNLSQLALAETAGVSQRHVSWLETGRSRPSRDMVLRLAEALEVPLRDRNTLLTAAGFAPQYRESALDEPHMASVLGALKQVLDHHDPLPAIVVDRRWRRIMGNRGSDLLLSLAGAPPESTQKEPFNLAEATLAEDGLRPFIQNADEVIPLFVQRLRTEAQSLGDPAGMAYVESLIRRAGLEEEQHSIAEPLLPVLPLRIAIEDVRLSMFTVISTFGTPQDITTDELRVEAFYPADDDTRRFFEQAVT